MKHKITALGMALILSTLFLSAFVTSASAAQYIRDYNGPHFTLGGGATFGGDTLGTVYYQGGGSSDIKAGELIHLYAGLMYHFYNSPIAWHWVISLTKPVPTMAPPPLTAPPSR